MSISSEPSIDVSPSPSEEVFKKFMEFNELLIKSVQHLGKTVDGHISQAELSLQNRNEMLLICSLLERIVNNFGELGSLLGTCVDHLKTTIELCSRERRQIYQNVGEVVPPSSTEGTGNGGIEVNVDAGNESLTTSSQNILNVQAQLSICASNSYGHYYFARSVAHQLQDMASDQIDIAQKLINEVLTQGRLGNLTSGSKLSNPDSESDTQNMT